MEKRVTFFDAMVVILQVGQGYATAVLEDLRDLC